MVILHLLAEGGMGGIESLMRDYSQKSKNNNIFAFVWGGGINAEEIKKNGSKTFVLDYRRNGAIKTICALFKIINDEGVNVVVSHHSTPLTRYFCYLVKIRKKRIKTCVYEHSDSHDHVYKGNSLKARIANSMIRKGVESADQVIAISNFVEKSCREVYNVDRCKIETIYNGVDSSKFDNEIEPDNIIPILIFVGRLIYEKGVQNTINALSMLEEENLSYEFWIVGDGNFRGELEKLVNTNSLEKHVKFLGSRNDVDELLKKADIFIHMPQWEEGFGITVIEAMASGKICVVGKSGALPEIIEDGIDGYIIDKDDIFELSNKLKKLILEYKSEENVIMKNNARNRATYFSIEKYVNNLDRVLINIK